MKISVILGHPVQGSFNHAIAKRSIAVLKDEGHQVIFHDLYREEFDPLLPALEIPSDGQVSPVIRRYCEEISASRGIIVVHPNWWGQPPAILKGWIDRVLRPGVAYEFLEGDTGEGVPRGLLGTDTALVFNTSNTPEEREHEVFGDPLQLLWKNCIFDLCGVRHFYRKMFRVLVTSSDNQRKQWLQEVEESVRNYFASSQKK
jgi:putative NADPH-quinone reductase